MGENPPRGSTVDATIICCGYGVKAFLAGGVPYLEFDDFAVDFERFGSEVNADCAIRKKEQKKKVESGIALVLKIIEPDVRAYEGFANKLQQ